MTAAALGLVLVPLLGRGRATPDRALYDLAVYREQLAEIARDVERGLLGEVEAKSARTEIEGRILAVVEAGDSSPGTIPAAPAAPATPSRGGFITAIALAATLPAGAVLVYLSLGSPGVPGLPFVERNAQGAIPAAVDRRKLTDLVTNLARRMEERPDDVEGWRLLARTYRNLGRLEAAREAYRRAIALKPGDAALLTSLGEMLVLEANGVVTSEARKQFEAARVADPKEPAARYYLGLARVQAGDRRTGLAQWLALEADSPPVAPWSASLREHIEKLAAELGLGTAARATGSAGSMSGPDAEAMARAAEMSAPERGAMIRGMIGRLAGRLEDKPGDLEGWLRLGRAYWVMGEAVKARDAFTRATRLKPDDLAILEDYAAVILEASPKGAAPPEAFEQTLRRILALDGENRNALWLLGLAEADAGNDEMAAVLWRRLLDLIPEESPDRAEIERRLESLNPAR